MMQHGPRDDDIGPVQPRSEVGDVGQDRLEFGWAELSERGGCLIEQTLGAIHADQHAARAKSPQYPPTETAGTAAEFHDAVGRAKSQFVEQLLGRLGKLRILN